MSILYGMMLEHWTTHKVVPTEASLKERIRGMYPSANDANEQRKRATLEQSLDKLKDSPLSDKDFTDLKIRQFSQYVSLRNFLIDTKDDLLANKFDPELPTKLRKAMSVGDAHFDVGHDWAERIDERVHNQVNPEFCPRIPTGLPHLDALISGGLQAGELGVLLALPKHFKSGTMLNFAHSALRQIAPTNVLYVTLELSEELVGMRFDMRTALRTKDDMHRDPEKFSRLVHERRDVMMGDNRLFIKGFKTKSCTCDTLRTYLDQMWAKENVKFGTIIVDYMDLLKSSKTREKAYLEAVDVCEDLRSVASKQEYSVPIWTAARATREAVGKRKINMAQMSSAFERVGVADLVLALCMSEAEKVAGEMRIVNVASRNDSINKVVNCKVTFDKMLLTSVGTSELDEEESEEEGDLREWKRKKKSSEDDGGDRRGGAKVIRKGGDSF